ncbi:MAG: hypothetical protein ACFE0J_19845 [Elainellaceae cyanobacterium]
MILRYVLAWIPMMFIGIVNGIIREVTYQKYLSELRAHQLSTMIGVLLLGLYIGLITSLWGFESLTQACLVGGIWLGLTVAFEFGFGHYVAKRPWTTLISDYNVLTGRIWIFVLIWIAIAPVLFYTL